MPSWQSSIVNWRSGDRARWSHSRAADAGLEGVEQEPGQDEVVRPVPVRREPLVRGVPVVDLGQDDKTERRRPLR